MSMGTLRFAHPTRDRLVIRRMFKGRQAVPIVGLVTGTLRFAHPTRDRFVICRMGKGRQAVPITLPPMNDQGGSNGIQKSQDSRWNLFLHCRHC